MKKDYRIVNVKNTPMMIFEEGELISDDIVMYNDFYEFWVFQPWLNFFPNKDLMIDIGANIGSHALQFKTNFPELEIWCFEPYFENFELLRQNVKNFKDIKSFNVGLGSSTSVVNFSNGEANNSGSVSITSNDENANIVIRLDDIYFYNKKISMIKIDVEGHEYSVVEGSLNTIKKHKPLIWIEDFTRDTIELLKSIGYQIIEEQKHSNFLMKYGE